MKRLTIFLFSITLHAATFYVSSAGSDSNNGSQVSPWLTLQHSVNSVACGDTINVVANGAFVQGDANLPNMPCTARITVQSSALSQFAPVGYRTNPANDFPLYGKLQFTSQGIAAVPAVWTFNTSFSYSGVSFNTSTNYATITGLQGLTSPNLANGSQIEIEVQSSGSNYGGPLFPSVAAPGGMSFLTHYYVVNCGSGPVGSQGYPQTCGQPNSVFQLAATSGGAPIAIASCGLYCANTVTTDPSGACTRGQIQYNTTDSLTWGCPGGTWTQSFVFMNIGVPTAADTSANTLTIPNNYGPGSLSNGNAVAFSAAGLQLFGTLPAPLQLDQIYYVQNLNLNGRTFQVSTDFAGVNIVHLTDVGAGMVSTATTAIASNWAFRGLEMAPNGTATPFYFFLLGKGSETSIYGMTSRMEVDRCYLHDNPPTQSIAHAIFENGTFLSVHDSWVIGANLGEAQAIGGPTIITNNFLEAAGEVTLYGGDWSPYSPPNANKLFSGNYFYKPPIWKVSTGTVAASGACLYDAADPLHAGGEWYKNTSSGQVYQCSGGIWVTSGFPLPVSPIIKDMTEHKNGRYFTYIGNLYNYSISQDQSGQLWNNSMEYGSGPGAANDHITIMNNAGYNSFTFMSRTSQCGLTSNAVCPILPGNHVTINNLLVLNPLVCGTSMNPGCGFSNASYSATTGGFAPYFNDDYWSHNTIWSPTGSGTGPDGYPFSSLGPMSADTPTGGCPPYSPLPVNRMIYKNSLVVGDFSGACNFAGAILLNNYSNSIFANNALKAAVGSYASVGATNSWVNGVFPANNTIIKFVNGNGAFTGDYHLDPTSPYSSANGAATQLATDGTDLGADIDLVNMATSGAAAGTPRWDRQAGLRVNPGSTQVVFRYSSPTADACTATIYGAPARIAANQVASAADSSANSISDALVRELYISGLQPSTQYWYKLACGGGVSLVGDVLTRKPGVGSAQFGFDWNSPTPMQYSSSRSMSNPVSLPAATRQFIPVAANSAVYVQTGAAGPITLLIAP